MKSTALTICYFNTSKHCKEQNVSLNPNFNLDIVLQKQAMNVSTIIASNFIYVGDKWQEELW